MKKIKSIKILVKDWNDENKNFYEGAIIINDKKIDGIVYYEDVCQRISGFIDDDESLRLIVDNKISSSTINCSRINNNKYDGVICNYNSDLKCEIILKSLKEIKEIEDNKMSCLIYEFNHYKSLKLERGIK